MNELNVTVAGMSGAANRECFGPPCFPLGMAYVPIQQWKELYDPELAMKRGTMFRQLDFPFIGEEAVPNGR